MGKTQQYLSWPYSDFVCPGIAMGYLPLARAALV
jgi:hypothetical protein